MLVAEVTQVLGLGGKQGLPCRKRLRTLLPLCQYSLSLGAGVGLPLTSLALSCPVHKPGIFKPLFGYLRPWVGVLAHQTGILSEVESQEKQDYVTCGPI